MKKKLTFTCILLCLCMAAAVVFTGCGNTNQNATADTASKATAFSTPRERLSQEPQASPEWVTKLDAAKNAKQLFVVAGYERSTAWISMHEKDENGNWKMLTSTPGFIGKEGLGKTKEGDGKTPVGTFRFNAAFGIADDPGCAIEYTKVDDNTYWSGDNNIKYNQMVSIKDYPNLNTEDSEHIVDYQYEYQYCMNISYNEEGTRLRDLPALPRRQKAPHGRLRRGTRGADVLHYAACRSRLCHCDRFNGKLRCGILK